MLPATPTPSTYIHPAWKSNKCELNSEESMFCTTTRSPSQTARPSPRKSSGLDSHIAYNRITPITPHWIATLSVWLCGLATTVPEASSATRSQKAGFLTHRHNGNTGAVGEAAALALMPCPPGHV